MNECRCDERLKDRLEDSTYLTYTGLYDKTKIVYYESRCEIRLMNEGRCDERLKGRVEEST